MIDINQETDDEGCSSTDPQCDTPPTDHGPPPLPGFTDETHKFGAAGEPAESIGVLDATSINTSCPASPNVGDGSTARCDDKQNLQVNQKILATMSGFVLTVVDH